MKEKKSNETWIKQKRSFYEIQRGIQRYPDSLVGKLCVAL